MPADSDSDPLDPVRHALEAGAHERALREAEAVVEAAPEDAARAFEAHHLAVKAAFRLGRRETALRHAFAQANAATSLDDPAKTARAHNDLAVVYGSGGIDDKAVEHLWQALHWLEGQDGVLVASPLNNLGNVYLGMGRTDEARALFQRAADAWREVGDAGGEALALSNIGRTEVQADRPQQAIPALDAALEAFERLDRPGDVAVTHAKLGVAYGALGQPHRARPAFERALALHAEGHGAPFEFDTRLWYGQWLRRVGESASACTQLERAASLKAQETGELAHSGVLTEYARALEAEGRFRDGMSALWRHLEARDASAHDKADLRARLRLLELEVGAEVDEDVSRMRRVELERTNRDLREQTSRLERLSTTDELTGLHNRRALNQRLEEEAARAMRYVRPLVLALVDLDGFKAVNDRFSHAVGDQVLQRTAQLLSDRLRLSDVAARWGGEEFALLLPDTELDDAERLLDEIRERLAAHDWSEIEPGLELTASIGAAALEEVDDLDDLMRLADRRLYGAKDAGRDRTVTEGRFRVPLS